MLHFAVAHLRGRSLPNDNDDDDDAHSQHSMIARETTGQVEDEDVTDRHVLILTPDQHKLRQVLVTERDTSFFSSSRSDSSSTALLNRIEIKHLPTSDHLLYFLTTMYSHSNHFKSREALVASGAKAKVDPSYLPIPPTLVLLHNPSEYLAEARAQSAGLEAYTSLLALFESASSHLSPSKPPLLMLYDPEASSLLQPLVAAHLAQPNSRRKRKLFEEDQEQEERPVEKMRLRDVLPFFYDWVGVSEPVHQGPRASQRASTFVLTYHPSPRASDLSFLPSTSNEERPPVAVEFSIQRLSEAEGDDEDGLIIQVVN